MEERGRVEGTDKSHTWIIDPLDGTTNFLHAIPHWAINIALEREGAGVVAAVTFNPAADELFWAEKGKGAFLNNERRLRVAARPQPRRGAAGRPASLLGPARPRPVPQGAAPDERAGGGRAPLRRRRAGHGGRRRGRYDAYWERGRAALGISLPAC
jgi:myo-inositol-1(or 4)-monophosphatase